MTERRKRLLKVALVYAVHCSLREDEKHDGMIDAADEGIEASQWSDVVVEVLFRALTDWRESEEQTNIKPFSFDSSDTGMPLGVQELDKTIRELFPEEEENRKREYITHTAIRLLKKLKATESLGLRPRLDAAFNRGRLQGRSDRDAAMRGELVELKRHIDMCFANSRIQDAMEEK